MKKLLVFTLFFGIAAPLWAADSVVVWSPEGKIGVRATERILSL